MAKQLHHLPREIAEILDQFRHDLEREGPAPKGRLLNMSTKQVVRLVLKQYPEFKAFSTRQLRIVKEALADAVSLSPARILSPDETDRLFRRRVPDSGTPSSALRAYRKRAGLTQIDLSERCGVPQPHISAMESRKRAIGLGVAKTLAMALGIDYRRLL